MYKILPDAKKKHQKSALLENIANIILIIMGITGTIIMWSMFNQYMSEEAFNKGYEKGFDACIEENNLYDRYETTYLPGTDGEIWERYHDCNMYGLPEYAKPYCEQEKIPNA